jgi:hypothetical protein
MTAMILSALGGNALRLSRSQRSALVNLGPGALPWINRAFGQKQSSPTTWVASITARALTRNGLATISTGSSRGAWLRLTPLGRAYAQTLAESEATARRSPGI